MVTALATFSSVAPAETRDRLSPEQLESLVQPAADLVGEDRIEEAKAAFEVILQRAPNRSRRDELDLYTAFGVELCNAHAHADASLPYLRKAVDLAGQAFGPEHPETALAYTDLGDCLGRVDASKTSEERRAAYLSAYRIRLRSLGPDDPETAAAMKALVRFTDDQDVHDLNAQQLAAASDLADRAVARFTALGEQYRPDLIGALTDRAKLSLKVGRMDGATADFEALGCRAGDAIDLQINCLDLCGQIARAFHEQSKAHQARDWSARCDALSSGLVDSIVSISEKGTSRSKDPVR